MTNWQEVFQVASAPTGEQIILLGQHIALQVKLGEAIIYVNILKKFLTVTAELESAVEHLAQEINADNITGALIVSGSDSLTEQNHLRQVMDCAYREANRWH